MTALQRGVDDIGEAMRLRAGVQRPHRLMYLLRAIGRLQATVRTTNLPGVFIAHAHGEGEVQADSLPGALRALADVVNRGATPLDDLERFLGPAPTSPPRNPIERAVADLELWSTLRSMLGLSSGGPSSEVRDAFKDRMAAAKAADDAKAALFNVVAGETLGDMVRNVVDELGEARAEIADLKQQVEHLDATREAERTLLTEARATIARLEQQLGISTTGSDPRPKLIGRRDKLEIGRWLFEADRPIKIGSNRRSTMVLEGEGVAPMHAVVETGPRPGTFAVIRVNGAVTVNGQEVERNQSLVHGDVICVGEYEIAVHLPPQP